MKLYQQLLDISKSLAEGQGQASYRRAVSTAYYSTFHCLAHHCADCLIGDDDATRPNKAWAEVYRALMHSKCAESCKRANSVDFPSEIRNFANNFVQLLEVRELADYDPNIKFSHLRVRHYVDLSERCIKSLESVSLVDRLAFSAWVLIHSGGVPSLRKRVIGGKTNFL